MTLGREEFICFTTQLMIGLPEWWNKNLLLIVDELMAFLNNSDIFLLDAGTLYYANII